MRALLTTLLAAALIVGPGVGAGQAAPLDRRELQARKDFASGRYEQAAEQFAELFAQTADPIYLRNVGRCYQKLKRPRDAINSFQEYLRRAKALAPAERDEIQGFIKEMEALASEPVAAPPPAATAPAAPTVVDRTPQPAPPAPAPGPPTSVTIQTPVVTIQTTGPQAPPSDGRALRIGGLVTAGAGVVLIGVGAAFGLAARSAGESVSDFYDPDKASAGKRDEKLQWVGYGVGAAAVVTGAVLYLTGRRPSETTVASNWRVAPLVGERAGGLSLGGGF